MRSVARTLVPGGRLVLIDGRPLAGTLETEPFRLVRPYGGGHREYAEVGGDYASDTRTGPQVEFLYSLGEIVSAAADAGLRVLRLEEHTAVSWDQAYYRLRREADGLYRRRVDGHALPIEFTLIAAR